MNDGINLNKPHLSHSKTDFDQVLFSHAVNLMMVMMIVMMVMMMVMMMAMVMAMMMILLLLVLTTASLKSYFTNRSIMF